MFTNLVNKSRCVQDDIGKTKWSTSFKNLLDEQSVELQHQSVECLKNIASTNNKEMVEKLVESGVHKKLVELVKGNNEQVVTATCVETLKEISKHVNLQQQLLN